MLCIGKTHPLHVCLVLFQVPLGGGGSGFLGTATGTFSSGMAFFGTAGTSKKHEFTKHFYSLPFFQCWKKKTEHKHQKAEQRNHQQIGGLQGLLILKSTDAFYTNLIDQGGCSQWEQTDVPLAGGASTFLGAGTGTFSSGTTFLGTSGT